VLAQVELWRGGVCGARGPSPASSELCLLRMTTRDRGWPSALVKDESSEVLNSRMVGSKGSSGRRSAAAGACNRQQDHRPAG